MVGGLAGLGAAAQAGKERVAVTDARGFADAMAGTGDDWGIISRAVEGPSYLLNSVRGDGLTRVEQMRTNLSAARRFLSDRGQAEAVQGIDRTLAALGGLRVVLALAEPDQSAAGEGVDAVSDACAACHARFREGSEQTGFRARPGLLE